MKLTILWLCIFDGNNADFLTGHVTRVQCDGDKARDIYQILIWLQHTQLWNGGNGFATVSKYNFIAVMLHATHKYPASSYKRNEEWSKYWGFLMTGRRTDVLETGDRLSRSLEHLQFTWISWHQGSRRLCRQPCWIIRHWAPTLPGRIFYSRPLLWGHSGTLPWQCQVKLIQPPLQSTSLHWFKLKWAR